MDNGDKNGWKIENPTGISTYTYKTDSHTFIPSCICDGYTLWKHPTGCKCGAAKIEKEIKEKIKKEKEKAEKEKEKAEKEKEEVKTKANPIYWDYEII